MAMLNNQRVAIGFLVCWTPTNLLDPRMGSLEWQYSDAFLQLNDNINRKK
jgi:hypothetical protein